MFNLIYYYFDLDCLFWQSVKFLFISSLIPSHFKLLLMRLFLFILFSSWSLTIRLLSEFIIDVQVIFIQYRSSSVYLLCSVYIKQFFN